MVENTEVKIPKRILNTLIASLASLITFREYTNQAPGKTRQYILLFSAFNFAFLLILVGVMLGLKAVGIG